MPRHALRVCRSLSFFLSFLLQDRLTQLPFLLSKSAFVFVLCLSIYMLIFWLPCSRLIKLASVSFERTLN